MSILPFLFFLTLFFIFSSTHPYLLATRAFCKPPSDPPAGRRRAFRPALHPRPRRPPPAPPPPTGHRRELRPATGPPPFRRPAPPPLRRRLHPRLQFLPSAPPPTGPCGELRPAPSAAGPPPFRRRAARPPPLCRRRARTSSSYVRASDDRPRDELAPAALLVCALTEGRPVKRCSGAPRSRVKPRFRDSSNTKVLQ
ncbi:hypothetical protein PVAP13_6KG242206 [Panicum virgatum]|uniref:Uncharacterized protein n=1 Tax=Panicum virgatum TaxID=38727 RepID=A0A8T0RGC3_PANVG|nr:hypothetical protein PVAP13_6KG242206 [Panicum virgatum]